MRSSSNGADDGPITLARMRPIFTRLVDYLARQRSLSDADREELSIIVEEDVRRGLSSYVYESPQQEIGWIRTLVFRRFGRFVWRRRAVLYSAELKETHAVEEEGIEERLIARERTAQLRAMLDRLSAIDRELLTHHYEYKVPYEELAERFGLTPATARKRAERAKSRLRDWCVKESFLV